MLGDTYCNKSLPDKFSGQQPANPWAVCDIITDCVHPVQKIK